MIASDIRVEEVRLETILHWRERYRREMGCQIVHDSIHGRRGWTREYRLCAGDQDVGYGSVAIGGPWTGKPTVFEFFVSPPHRLRVFDYFSALLDASLAVAIEVQSNDSLACTLLHTFAREVQSRSILFHDRITTDLVLPQGARVREATAADFPDVTSDQLLWHRVVEVDGKLAGKGGILFHYNPPYGDIFMEVSTRHRRRGFGSYLVQELKHICYRGGHVPCARCATTNLASRKTLQRAGFVPCGLILSGSMGEWPPEHEAQYAS